MWDGKVPPKLALDRAAERGDLLLRRFEKENRGGADPATPARTPRKK